MQRAVAIGLILGLNSLPLQVNSETFYFHNDHMGTPQSLTNKDQEVVWKAEYDPFGKATEVVAIVELNIRKPGQYLDRETGLHYNYFRTYDPETGRYITSDPIGLNGGLNTYGYVSQNPVNYFDPLGLIEIPDDFVGPPPVNGYRTSEMTVTPCGRIPPGPPGEFVGMNMWVANQSWNPLWFYAQVKNGSPWDYKQYGRKFEDFGNFNFGATAKVFGIPNQLAQRGAGWANSVADRTRTGLGSWWWQYPYGDDPADQDQISNGQEYCSCVGI